MMRRAWERGRLVNEIEQQAVERAAAECLMKMESWREWLVFISIGHCIYTQ